MSDKNGGGMNTASSVDTFELDGWLRLFNFTADKRYRTPRQRAASVRDAGQLQVDGTDDLVAVLGSSGTRPAARPAGRANRRGAGRPARPGANAVPRHDDELWFGAWLWLAGLAEDGTITAWFAGARPPNWSSLPRCSTVGRCYR